MYLARDILGSKYRYFLRQSYRDEQGILCFRELYDLDDDPGRFINYISDNAFYISDELVDAVAPHVKGDAADMLEELLWPFVQHDVRTKLEPFMRKGQYHGTSPLTEEELRAIDREIHIFDRRRMHYLWYGAIDQSRLHKMPAKLSRRLLGKSRDEKEQYFIAKEMVFYADEVKEYLYTVFNLQQHFSQTIARIMPQGLDQDTMDTCFLDELCRLNRDTSFWQGMPEADTLQPYLIRYLIMFFDYDFGQSSALNDYIKQFMDSRRQFSYPQKTNAMGLQEASSIFGKSTDELQKMSKKELTKLYRQKAKELHPDTPEGEHDQFVRLTRAFESLRDKP